MVVEMLLIGVDNLFGEDLLEYIGLIVIYNWMFFQCYVVFILVDSVVEVVCY